MLFSTCTFPLKTIDPVSRLGLRMTCRKIFFILALYSSKWFVFFFFFLLWHFSFLPFLKNVNRFYLSADLFPDFLICSSPSSSFSFFFFRTQVPEKSVCLHAAFRQSLSLFLFFAAAGSLDKEEQSKPLVCLKKKKNLKLSRRPNDDIEGQRKNVWKGFFFAYWEVVSSQKASYRDRRTVVPYVLLTWLLLELIRPTGRLFMNVPQVMVFHYFTESSDTTTYHPLALIVSGFNLIYKLTTLLDTSECPLVL